MLHQLGNVMELNTPGAEREQRNRDSRRCPGAQYQSWWWRTHQRIDSQRHRASSECADQIVIFVGAHCGPGDAASDQSPIVPHGFDCSFIGGTFRCQPQLIGQRTQCRQDRNSQLSNQQESMVILIEMGTLMSEENLALFGLERIKHSPRHDNTPW